MTQPTPRVRIRKGDDDRWYVQQSTIQVHGAQWTVLFGPWAAVAAFANWRDALAHAEG